MTSGTVVGLICALISSAACAAAAVFFLVVVIGFVVLRRRGKTKVTVQEASRAGMESVSQVFVRGSGGLQPLDDDDGEDDDDVPQGASGASQAGLDLVRQFVASNLWQEVEVEANGQAIEFVVFDWEEVRERDEDQHHIVEYFIGDEGEVCERVERGEYIPLAAGGMYPDALEYDGGFAEMGHEGLLLADVRGPSGVRLVFFHLDQVGPLHLDVTLDDLGGGGASG